MTYQDETVVGWCIHEGHINWSQTSVGSAQLWSINSAHHLPELMDSITNNTDGDSDTGASFWNLARSHHHKWLVFVTESGRVFDLDLSAFQFGNVSELPHILEALPIEADHTAFHGRYERERFHSVNMPDFAKACENMIQNQFHHDHKHECTSCQGTMYKFTRVLAAFHTNKHTMSQFGEPEHFWSELRDYSAY